ncbi:rCG32646 [Rattus norvegicus]|uniref:RCG32646 n=1 Tax=Rattus norvegicus TaxID=10116 RepID=A6HGE2_RAT|nr:rCG32646 [Rattus norvegicus]
MTFLLTCAPILGVQPGAFPGTESKQAWKK